VKYTCYYDRKIKEEYVMKDSTKGVIATVAVALICREFYAKGYNAALKKLNEMAEFKESCLKEKGEGES
jgi:hypothetical protein